MNLTLTYLDMAAIGVVFLLTRPIGRLFGVVSMALLNWIAERILEAKHGRDVATIMIAQSGAEPITQLARDFIPPIKVELDERRPIRRSNI